VLRGFRQFHRASIDPEGRSRYFTVIQAGYRPNKT
jgi:hypothetical protein